MNPAWAQPLGWALVHSLWQVSVLALLYRAARPALAGRPRLRYGAGLALLALGLLGMAVTLSAQRTPGPQQVRGHATHEDHPEPAGSGPAAPASVERPTERLPELVAATFDRYLESGVALWFLGLAAAGFVLAVAYERCRELAEGARPATSPVLLAAVERCRARLRVRTEVGVAVSSEIDSPIQLGWLKPSIVLPAALEQELDIHQIESLAAHELAHVKRRDYPVNLVQVILEGLLFFHPAARWLSREVRIAREHCCDDLAAAASRGGPLGYARSLARLEEIRSTPAVVLSVADGDLYRRIDRLLPADARGSESSSALALGARAFGCLALAGVVLFAGLGIADASASATTVLDGNDPVLLVEGREVQGTANRSLHFDGYRYLFAGRETFESFRRNPERYAVRNARVCPITGGGVRPDAWRVVDGRILMFCCDSAPEPLIREAARTLAPSLES